MEKEKTAGQQLAEKILYEPEHIWDAAPQARQEAMDFCEDYKSFLNAAKTEREAVSEIVRRVEAAGYVPFEVGKTYSAGDKIYFNNREKAVICATLGQKGVQEGTHLMIAHIDSPRLESASINGAPLPCPCMASWSNPTGKKSRSVLARTKEIRYFV